MTQPPTPNQQPLDQRKRLPWIAGGIALVIGFFIFLAHYQREATFEDVMTEVIAKVIPEERELITKVPPSNLGLGTVYRLKTNPNEQGADRHRFTNGKDWWAPELPLEEQEAAWADLIGEPKALAIQEISTVLKRNIQLSSAATLRNVVSKLRGTHEGTDGSVVEMSVGKAYYREIEVLDFWELLESEKLKPRVIDILNSDAYALVYAEVTFEDVTATIEVNSDVASGLETEVAGDEHIVTEGAINVGVERQAENVLKLTALEPMVVAVKIGRMPVAGLMSADAEWKPVDTAQILEDQILPLIDELDGVN